MKAIRDGLIYQQPIPRKSFHQMEVATREKIEMWNHHKKIAKEVPKVSDIEIGLLIGANCAKALEPQEVISIKDGGPFPTNLL